MQMVNEKNVLLNAIQEAGEAVVTMQKTGFTVTKKANNDIVTKADLLANDILKTALLTHFPEDGWLSEESADDAQRLSCERVWVVDPIDGTKEFASGLPEYAISVALVKNGIPIMAAVFNPAKHELFFAEEGKGAWLGQSKITCASPASNKKLTLLASRSEFARGEWTRFSTTHQVQQVGSIAYKLALVAAGHGDATFSLGPKNEWDIAAGCLMISEAGGFVSDKQKQPIIFNREIVKVNGIVATASSIKDHIFSMIAVKSQ